MALHGRTKIELTDVHTGKVETIEKNNFITNGAAMFLNPIGGIWTNYEIYNLKPLTTLFGSCLLFDTPIAGDENTIFPAANNKFLGGGDYGIVNSTTDVHYGNYNSAESIIDEVNRTATFVYDFATNQCNGNIGAVCLAPLNNARAAAFGVDTPLQYLDNNYSQNQIYVSTPYQEGGSGNNVTSPKYMYAKAYTSLYNSNTYMISPIAVNLENNYAYYFNYSANTVEKLSIPITRESLFTNNSKWAATILESNGITFPDGVTLYPWGANMGMYDDTHFWIFGYDTANTTTSNVYMFVVDVTSGTITKTVTIKNPTTDFTVSKWTNGMFYSTGYVLFTAYYSPPSWKNSFYRVNENNPTDISIPISDLDNDRWGRLYPVFDLNGRVYLNDGQYLYNQSPSIYNYRVWNVTENTILGRYSTYGAGDTRQNAYYGYIRDMNNPLFMIMRTNETYAQPEYGTGYCSRIKSFLSTINNLDEIVTKTSDKTMKITYTLTEVAE